MAEIERVIDRSEIVELIEGRIAAHQARLGRPRQISVKALLVALLANAESGRLFLINVPGYFDSLPAKTRERLGITRTGRVTRRQVESLYGLICRSLENEGAGRLDSFDELCEKLLVASAHHETRTSRDIAIDGTSIASWGTRRKPKPRKKTKAAAEAEVPVEDAEGSKDKDAKKKTKKDDKETTDPDPRWRGKGQNAWKRPVFGYDLTVAVTIPNGVGRPVPMAATTMRFRPAGAGKESLASALAVAEDTARNRGGLGDVLVDREYTQRIDGSDFILPLRALGAEPVFELKVNQRGARGTQRGALVVDGQPYSPAMPEKLHDIAQPAVNATLDKIQAYQHEIGLREQYRLIPHGSRRSDGSQVYQCPASAGKLRCPLVATSQLLALGTMPAFPPLNPMAGSVCTKKYTTFAAHELPLSQREQYGSFDWYLSMNRRNRVEGFFGNLKDKARENLNRGTIRVRGIFKTGLLVAIAVASVNMRLADKWQSDKAQEPTRKKMGRPRKSGVATYARVFATLGAHGPPGA